MRTPNKRQINHSKRILKLAASDDDDQRKVWQSIEIMEQVTAENPFISAPDLKAETVRRAIEAGINDMEAERIYRAASQVVVPFMKSGEIKLRADALIDGLVKQASNHMMEDVYDRNGFVIGQKFSSNNMNAITKALNVKLQTLTKIQSNLILAQKETADIKDTKDFRISDADKDQLERFVGGEFIDNPEIVEMLISQSDNKEFINIKGFYENEE